MKEALTLEQVWGILEEIARRQEKTDRQIAELSKNIGGLNNSIGKFTEEMFSVRVWKKFDAFGYEFTQGSRERQFIENKRVVAEADVFLENGDYAMPIEIKRELTVEDVDDHLERIETIRGCMDNRGDKRKLVGAVAGAIVSENVRTYARKKGLYLLVQSGEAVTIAEPPRGFTPREW